MRNLGSAAFAQPVRIDGHLKREKLFTVPNERVHTGDLMLINRDTPLRFPLAPDKLASLSSQPAIASLDPDMRLEETCLRQLAELLRSCGGTEEIVAVSGYRTRQDQADLYGTSLIENGAAYTAAYVALPDRSEHQSGLAIDVGLRQNNVHPIAPAFPDTGSCGAFKRLAAGFGFIQRYKEHKRAITGIACEPWHFRYVGYPHASLIERHDLCLEEYIDWLAGFTFEGNRLRYVASDVGVSAEIYYVPAEARSVTSVPIAPCDAYRLSGNNRDGFIVTVFGR